MRWRRDNCLAAKVARRGLGRSVGQQVLRSTHVSDEDVDPATEQGGAHSAVLPGASGDTYAAWRLQQIAGGNPDDAAVKWGLHVAAHVVEEAQADITNRTETSELLLLVFR